MPQRPAAELGSPLCKVLHKQRVKKRLSSGESPSRNMQRMDAQLSLCGALITCTDSAAEARPDKRKDTISAAV